MIYYNIQGPKSSCWWCNPHFHQQFVFAFLGNRSHFGSRGFELINLALSQLLPPVQG